MKTHHNEAEPNEDKINSSQETLCVPNNDHLQTRSASLLSGHPVLDARLVRRLHPNTKKTLLTICTVMLVFWCFWWIISMQRHELQASKHLWFPPGLNGIGNDFYNHVDHAARIWWTGGDPYADKIRFFPYPPSEMRFFAWVNLMTPHAALVVWLVLMAGIIAAAARTASLWRRYLSLEEIPPIVAIVLILFSTPTLFAMERGQYDPLSLLFILAALPFLNHSAKWAQFLAGAILCLTPWVKVYPGLIFVGLIGLQRWRALAGFVVVSIVIATAFLLNGEMQRFLVNNMLQIQISESLVLLSSGTHWPWEHPLSNGLASLWLGTKFNWLGLLPGKIMAAMLLIPLLAWVTYYVYKCPRRKTLTYPYLLWIVALATFVPPVSNDYNLIFLPIAILAVWNRHDPLMVQFALALLLIWWQPVGMPINGHQLLVIKFLGLGAVAICLVKRASEQTTVITVEGMH